MAGGARARLPHGRARQGRSGRHPGHHPARRRDHDLLRRRYRREERHRAAAGGGGAAERRPAWRSDAGPRATHEAGQDDQHHPAEILSRHRHQGAAAALQGEASRSCWSTGRPIPTARSTRSATASTNSTPGINGPTSLAAIKVADDDLAAIMATLQGARPRPDQHLRHRRPRLQHHIEAEQDQPCREAHIRKVPRAIAAGFPGDRSRRGARPAAARAAARARRSTTRPASIRAAPRDPRARSGEARRRDRGQRRHRPHLSAAGNAKELAPKVVKALLAQDYTSGIFVDDDLGPIPGTLPLSTVGLKGGARTPTPVDRGELPLRDDRLRPAAVLHRHRHGRHAAAGPGPSRQLQPRRYGELHGGDRPRLQDRLLNAAPVSNADIAPTLAQAIGVNTGAGRQAAGPRDHRGARRRQAGAAGRKDMVSPPGDGGLRTIVNLQFVGRRPISTPRVFPDGRSA